MHNLDINTVTWKDIEARKGVPCRELKDNIKVMFVGSDLADNFAIIRDLADDSYHFLLFLEADLENATEIKTYDNAAEAALWMSYRFLLDNADGADSYDPSVRARHSKHQNALSDLID